MTLEDRAKVIRERMRSDITNTLRQHFGPGVMITSQLVDALVDDGMFMMEHLLVEAATFQQQLVELGASQDA